MKTLQEIIGMGKRQSQNAVESLNMIYRLIRVDGENILSWPAEDDVREDRVCVEIDGGKVTKAIIM